MDQESARRVQALFAQVTEALARATFALLNADSELGRQVVADDRAIDERVAAAEESLWGEVSALTDRARDLRHAIAMLLVLPELERSADLAEHIAERALFGLGGEMTPVSRGIVQRMSEVAIEMWRAAADAFENGEAHALELHETDEELDILHERLTAEVSGGAMQPSVAAQVTLVARFYERLGDHAVNLSRRVATLEE